MLLICRTINLLWAHYAFKKHHIYEHNPFWYEPAKQTFLSESERRLQIHDVCSSDMTVDIER